MVSLCMETALVAGRAGTSLIDTAFPYEDLGDLAYPVLKKVERHSDVICTPYPKVFPRISHYLNTRCRCSDATTPVEREQRRLELQSDFNEIESFSTVYADHDHNSIGVSKVDVAAIQDSIPWSSKSTFCCDRGISELGFLIAA